jgi:Arc/MetJ family transcription regulator
MMRTTITVDDELFAELMELSGAETKTEAVRGAIEEYVRQRRKRRLIALRGDVDVDDNIDELRELERREGPDDDGHD